MNKLILLPLAVLLLSGCATGNKYDDRKAFFLVPYHAQEMHAQELTAANHADEDAFVPYRDSNLLIRESDCTVGVVAGRCQGAMIRGKLDY